MRNTLKRYYDNLESYEASVKSLALKEEALCCDETGVSVTNSYFNENAKKLAKVHGVEIVDRETILLKS